MQMARPIRFVMALILGLAIVTIAASTIVVETASGWFEKDVRLRAELAVSGTRQAFLEHLDARDAASLRKLLDAITHDERILAAAACDADGSALASTSEYPAEFSCSALVAGMGDAQSGGSTWTKVKRSSAGDVHVSAVPLRDGDRVLGFAALVHDLGFAARRESSTRTFLLVAFAFLAVAASAVTMIAARISWRGWSAELRRFLRGDAHRPEFQPILRDVRELVDRLVAEKEGDREGGAWTADRLKQTLRRHLHGEQVVVLANREPYMHERGPDGAIRVIHPASGLVTALEPVLRACSGVWVAHGSGSADRATADAHGRVRVPPGEESFAIRRVWLSQEDERGYYFGFSNEGLWPLCHIADVRPTFRADDWDRYRAVNEVFARAVCDEVDSEDPIILVQDYHFALAPRLIRERLPRATIIAFWHIPWPNSERFGICPWREELLDGMLGASIMGFHTQFHCNNFLDSVDRFLEARIDREQSAVVQQGRPTFVRAYPISIEWPTRGSADVGPSEECRASVRGELGLPADALIGLGVDRLDYTKGVEERFAAVERLLEVRSELRGRFTFVQVAAQSRTAIEKYRQLNEAVEQLAARINARFASGSYRPIVLLREHHESAAIVRFYRAAEVCYVSSLHDGMNLVAKEFVAARDDERGVLVLSQFTGAARELTEALIVNPYDIDEASAALATALSMAPEEQRDRMRSMRAFVSEFNVYRWAGRMLADAARLRTRDRLTRRLTDHLVAIENRDRPRPAIAR
jgi:trehalose 6-phosphate synthase